MFLTLLAEIQSAIDLADVIADMPLAWSGVLIGGFAVGLVLLLFGNRLAKKGVMLGGLVIGGLAATAAATQLSGDRVDPGTWLLAFGIGGALAGVLLAWLLFRFWMAAITAVVLAAVVPLSAMIWEGNGPSLSALDNTQQLAENVLGVGESDSAAEAIRQGRASGNIADNDLVGPPAPALETLENNTPSTDQTQDQGQDQDQDQTKETQEDEPVKTATSLIDRTQLLTDLRAIANQQIDEVKLWWTEMPTASRRVLQLGAGIGACSGVVLGLAAPLVAASLQSALLGGVLLFITTRGLILAFAPSLGGVLPTEWRGVLLSVGLITLLGLLIQWALRQRQADEPR